MVVSQGDGVFVSSSTSSVKDLVREMSLKLNNTLPGMVNGGTSTKSPQARGTTTVSPECSKENEAVPSISSPQAPETNSIVACQLNALLNRSSSKTANSTSLPNSRAQSLTRAQSPRTPTRRPGMAPPPPPPPKAGPTVASKPSLPTKPTLPKKPGRAYLGHSSTAPLPLGSPSIVMPDRLTEDSDAPPLVVSGDDLHGCTSSDVTSTSGSDSDLTDPSLMDEGWFHPDLQRESAEKLLLKFGQNGGFVIRRSSSGKPFALSVYFMSKVYHLEIRQKDSGYFALGIEKFSEQEFSCMQELVTFYRSSPLYLVNPRLLIDCDSPDDLRKITPIEVCLTDPPARLS